MSTTTTTSAKREGVFFFCLTSEKPTGSQLTDDFCPLKGIGSGPSPPTYPLANSFNDVDALEEERAGAKAAAEPARAAIVNTNLAMVDGQERGDVGKDVNKIVSSLSSSPPSYTNMGWDPMVSRVVLTYNSYVSTWTLYCKVRTPKDLCSTRRNVAWSTRVYVKTTGKLSREIRLQKQTTREKNFVLFCLGRSFIGRNVFLSPFLVGFVCVGACKRLRSKFSTDWVTIINFWNHEDRCYPSRCCNRCQCFH